LKIDSGKPILSANDQRAMANRARLRELGLTAVNVLASPGAGKTSVIKRLLEALRARCALGVIEGDVAGRIDADAILAMGIPATQINTDGGCHLDAAMIEQALGQLAIRGPGLVFIENIGNLICPTGFALGESMRLVIASVPEGHDKPLKYPGVFQTADAVVLNKLDLIEHVDFDLDFFTRGVRAVNPAAPIYHACARTGKGFDELVAMLARHAGI
jgi:hydrogenase nickel incorporation protein HypB